MPIIWWILAVCGSAQGLYRCGPEKAKSYGKGDKVPVCMHFSNGNKILFEPRLDVYSAMQAKGTYYYFLTNSSIDSGPDPPPINQTTDDGRNLTDFTFEEVRVAVQAQGTNLTAWLPYLTGDLVAKVYSVVVYVSDGKPDYLEWDNTCSHCGDGCFKSPTDPGEEVCADAHCQETNSTDCDPRLYVSWIGKDDAGLNLNSAGYRISSFRKYSLYDTYTEAKQNF